MVRVDRREVKVSVKEVYKQYKLLDNVNTSTTYLDRESGMSQPPLSQRSISSKKEASKLGTSKSAIFSKVGDLKNLPTYKLKFHNTEARVRKNPIIK